MTHTEIERKYLVSANCWQGNITRYFIIEQGYLACSTEETPEIRVRLIKECGKNSAFITVKSQGDLLRTEIETEIPFETGQELMKLSHLKIIKTRNIVDFNKQKFEIDVYEGDLRGLVTAEIELESVNQNVIVPGWLGEEITFDKAYKNANLAKHGLPKSFESSKINRKP